MASSPRYPFSEVKLKKKNGVVMKDQSVQTDPTPRLCAHQALFNVVANRLARRREGDAPQITIEQYFTFVYGSVPTNTNQFVRDIAIEAPDRTYYGSHQLTYFRHGNFVYRGWTYETLDGRIEHVPRYPRGIPIDQLRVEKPRRSPGML